MKLSFSAFVIASALGAVESILTKEDFEEHGKDLGACEGLPCGDDDDWKCNCKQGILACMGTGCAGNPDTKCSCQETTLETVLGAEVGADTYSFNVFLTNDHIAYINSIGSVCLMKGAVEEPKFEPVWVSSAPFQDMTFAWEKAYKAFYSNSVYDGGVTIEVAGDIDAKLGSCTSLTMDDILTPCQDTQENALALRNDRMSGDWIMGLEQTLVSSANGKALFLGDNPLYAARIGNEGGLSYVKPTETITVGICDKGEGELATYSELAGATTFTASAARQVRVTFDGAKFLSDASDMDDAENMLRGAGAVDMK